MLSMFYVFRWYLKIPFTASTYKPQLVEHVRETCYRPHSVTPGEVPNTNHSSYLSQDYQTRRLIPKRAIFLDPAVQATTRTLTLARLADPSHNSRNARIHLPSRATSQRMSRVCLLSRAITSGISFWAITQGIPFWGTTQGMSQQSPFLRCHPKPRRPRAYKETSHKSWKTLSLIMHLKLLFQAHHTNTWPWTQDIHSTNLPTRGPASTNLPARSPTLRTSSPVVQHTWSNNYKPLCSQQPSSVSTEHTNIPTRILTREHHNMNLPVHIITCSLPAMNLLAHGTIKHLLTHYF